MHPQSIFSVRHWNLPELLFVASACFAIGAAGFFLAVFLQLRASSGNSQIYANSIGPSVEQRAQYMDDVAEKSGAAAAATTEAQASKDDPLAAQKLKYMQRTSSQ